jgi:chemotaxis protein histidine kinase CheA
MDDSHEQRAPDTAAERATGVLNEDSVEEARLQLAFLEEGMGALRETPDAHALMDEAYRAAHSLKGALEQAELPHVVRIARLVQEVVRAARAGRLSVSAEMGSLISAAARGARESLEARVAGSPDSGAAESAAVALESLLARPAQPRDTADASQRGSLVLTRVDARRLHAAIETARDTVSASASFARSEEDAAALLSEFRTAAGRQEQASRELLDAIPGGLAAAARGQPTTGIAGELAGRVAAFGRITADVEESLLRFAARLREAAQKGARAAAAASGALGRIGGVHLASLFAGFPRLMRRYAQKLRRAVDVVVDTGVVEIDASLAALVATAVNRCGRAFLDQVQQRPRRTRKGGAPGAVRLLLQASVAPGEVLVKLVHEGHPLARERLEKSLEDLRGRLGKKGITFELETNPGERSLVLLKVPRPRGPGLLAESFILGRAGDYLYAIPASSIEECVAALPAGTEYLMRGERLPIVSMGGSAATGAGVVVRAEETKVVLLFDSLEGEENLSPAPIEYAAAQAPGIAAAAARADGSVALILDVASYLSAKRAPANAAHTRPRKRKR